jgi:hypothetical protein
VKRALAVVPLLALLLVACTAPAPPPSAEPVRPAPAYAVGAPFDYSSGGGVSLPGRACPGGDIARAAVTTVAADGVLGRIALSEPGCELSVDTASLRLLDAHGHPLAVSAGRGDPVNPPTTTYVERAQSTGRVRIGFAWTGSYCGPAAAAVQLRVNGKPLDVLLSGVQPRCAGRSVSALVPGTVGAPGQPVEPVPADWSTLRARLIVAPLQSGPTIPVTVELTTTGTRPVALTAPCPAYTGYSQLGDLGRGTPVEQVGAGGLLCDRAYVVEPGRPLRIALPPYAFPGFSDIPRTPVHSGDPVSVTFSMAGLEPVSASAHVR